MKYSANILGHGRLHFRWQGGVCALQNTTEAFFEKALFEASEIWLAQREPLWKENRDVVVRGPERDKPSL